MLQIQNLQVYLYKLFYKYKLSFYFSKKVAIGLKKFQSRSLDIKRYEKSSKNKIYNTSNPSSTIIENLEKTIKTWSSSFQNHKRGSKRNPVICKKYNTYK